MKTITKTLFYLQTAAILVTTVLAGPGSCEKGVPFRGSLEGFYTSVPGVQPSTMSASGKASLIGRFAFAWEGEVTPDGSSAFGTVEFIAANGDRIFGEFTGVATLIAPPIIWIEENVTITGGTGRFADAAGNLLMKRSVDITTGFTAGSFEGTIDLDNQTHRGCDGVNHHD
jgi:hypothetical protein